MPGITVRAPRRAASPAPGGITEEAGGAVGREGACGGTAGLGHLSTAVSRKAFWWPGTLSRGRGPCGHQSTRLRGFARGGGTAPGIVHELLRRASVRPHSLSARTVSALCTRVPAGMVRRFALTARISPRRWAVFQCSQGEPEAQRGQVICLTSHHL